MHRDNKRPQGDHSKRKISTLNVTEECLLMDFLLRSFKDRNRNAFKTLLKFKKIKVDDKVVFQYNYPLKPGQKVDVCWDKEDDNKNLGGIKILYEDKDIIVINKPSGILSVATPTERINTVYYVLCTHVKKQFKGNKLFVVHRLDRDTSGIMMYAKDHDLKEQLKDDWYNNVLERTYIAVVEGRIKPSKGTITSLLKENKDLIVYSTQDSDGKRSVTHYETIKSNGKYSLLKVDLETGRKNQIRVHMHDKHTPVIGDEKYGAQSDPIGRIGLHAQILAFKHPRTGEVLRFESDIPRKFMMLFPEEQDLNPKF